MSRVPALGPRGEGWVLIQVVLFAGVAAAGLVRVEVAPPLDVVISAIGVVLVLLGGLLAVRGVLDLREALTPLPHPRPGAELVESGSYRLVRHPIYGGIIVAAAGYGLAMHAPLAIAGAAVLLGFFRLKSGLEEAWLRDRYPGYAAYAGRTKRLIPFVY